MRASLGVAAGCGVIFAGLTLLVLLEWDPLMDADLRAVDPITDITRENDTYRSAISGITYALNSQFVMVYVALVAAALAARTTLRARAGAVDGGATGDAVPPGGLRRYAAPLWLLLVVGIGSAVNPLLKVLIDRDRPTVAPAIDTFSGLSFPSGHASSATLACVALLVLGWPLLGVPARVVAVAVAVALPVLSAWTRLAVGGHYLSDLAGGFLVGIGWVALWVPALRSRRPAPRGS